MQLNRDRLAEFLGCSLRTIDEYSRQGMPGEAPKKGGDSWKFESAAVVGWLRERERTNALGDLATLDEKEAKRRKLAAEAALAEHELALKTGAAVALNDFESAKGALIGAARAKFLGFGAALGPEVALLSSPQECSLVIENAVKEALRELSDNPPTISFEPFGTRESPTDRSETGGSVGTSAEPDRKRVGRRRTPAKH